VKLHYYQDRVLSPAAAELVDFDAESIQHIVSSVKRTPPDIWLLDPEGYEKNGRVLRDTESPRMLAYSQQDHMLYATDGCNSCFRQLPADLQRLSETELQTFATENELRPDLLKCLGNLLHSTGSL
jgi:hypothetical protein